ncbi:helix-hairpin-helix domain-containing protein [Nocardia sp. NPDC058497]|uniref:helix-hairpin-helix domain-containing protein n=1 Tax=Nocardia sp. NPDC058497 TaxID=3346529 RepID=UPI003648A674
MSRHEEHERVRQRLGGLAVREKAGPGGLRSESGRGPTPAGAGIDDGAEGRWDDDELTPSGGEVRAPGWLDDGAQPRGLQRLVPERFRGARLDPGRRGALVLGLVGLVAVVLTGIMVVRDQPTQQAIPPVPVVRAESIGVRAEPTATAAAVSGTSPSVSTEVVVSVVGLVDRPGLHRLPSGSRIADAIEIAGGARDDADLAGLNLAQRLSDGDQLVVGATGPQSGPPPLGSTMISAADHAPATAASTTGTNTATAPNGKGGKARLNLNTATEAELDALPGVGPVTATAILAWRSTNGRFTDVAQLGEVDGIGPARLARLRDLVTT